MLGAIRYNFANLANFHGRDARQTFWYYVLFLIVIQFAISMVGTVPMYIEMFTTIFDAASQGLDPDAAMRSMMSGMVDQIRTQMIVGMVIAVVSSALFVAAFVRRLHDVGYTGWIALIPIATQAFSVAYSWSMLDQIGDMMLRNMEAASAGGGDPFSMQAEMGWYSLVGWIGYLVVIGFGSLKGEAGPNQYGEEPVNF